MPDRKHFRCANSNPPTPRSTHVPDTEKRTVPTSNDPCPNFDIASPVCFLTSKMLETKLDSPKLSILEELKNLDTTTGETVDDGGTPRTIHSARSASPLHFQKENAKEVKWDSPIPLKDGEKCEIRGITPEDHDNLIEFHESLSDETKYNRFHHPTPHLSESQVDYFTHVDGHDRVAFVVLHESHIVAVARYDVTPSTKHAEYAIVIRDTYQGHGLGRILMTRLLLHAKENGVKRMFGEIRRENNRMEKLVLHLAKEMGLRCSVEREVGDVVDVISIALEKSEC
ncbi:hypothetical protein HK098_003125 [Nowakowskiella sp. JEL0407]|nr:hypothetical protein HK098_003125 [Nowakowskiella sp. JEL0407]